MVNVSITFLYHFLYITHDISFLYFGQVLNNVLHNENIFASFLVRLSMELIRYICRLFFIFFPFFKCNALSRNELNTYHLLFDRLNKSTNFAHGK